MKTDEYKVEIAGYLKSTFYVLCNGERVDGPFNHYSAALSAKLAARQAAHYQALGFELLPK